MLPVLTGLTVLLALPLISAGCVTNCTNTGSSIKSTFSSVSSDSDATTTTYSTTDMISGETNYGLSATFTLCDPDPSTINRTIALGTTPGVALSVGSTYPGTLSYTEQVTNQGGREWSAKDATLTVTDIAQSAVTFTIHSDSMEPTTSTGPTGTFTLDVAGTIIPPPPPTS